MNRFYSSEKMAVHQQRATKLHDETLALKSGIYDECMTVEGDKRSGVLINRLEGARNEISASDVRSHE